MHSTLNGLGNIYRVTLADALRAADEQRRKSAVANALQHLETSGITQNRPVRVASKPANGEGSGH
jgi:hypothetical protein